MASFWQWFTAHLDELRRLNKPHERLWALTLVQLKKVDERLRFELSDVSHPVHEFIITAEGNVDAFPIAEELVRVAPSLEGWVFVALKPAMGFYFNICYEGIDFAPERMWFLPLEIISHPEDLGIRVGIENMASMDETVAHDALLVILDTALGERSAALDIRHTEVVELPPDPESEGYIELPELPAYIAWHKRRFAGEPDHSNVS